MPRARHARPRGSSAATKQRIAEMIARTAKAPRRATGTSGVHARERARRRPAVRGAGRSGHGRPHVRGAGRSGHGRPRRPRRGRSPAPPPSPTRPPAGRPPSPPARACRSGPRRAPAPTAPAARSPRRIRFAPSAAAAAGACATVVERSRTSARPPGRCDPARQPRHRSTSPRDTDSHTVPTGLSSVPPPGPAIPVIADADLRAEARPRAVGQRLGDLHRHRAVRARSAPGRTPASSAFASFAVRRPRRPGRTPTTPGSSVSRAASSPPVHDSAHATVIPGDRSSVRDLVVDGRVRRRRTAMSRVALARRRPRARRYASSRAGLAARDDLDLAAPQAGRDLQRIEVDPVAPRATRSVSAISDSGMPNSRSIRCRYSTAPASRGAGTRRSRPPPPTSPEARAAARAARRRRPLAASARRHHQPRRGSRPARGSPRPRARSPACGWPAGSPPRRDSASASRSGRTISWIRASSASSSTISRPWKRADHLRRQVVGGRPQPAARDDQRPALRRAGSASAASMSSGRSPTIVDVREVDAQLEQPVGEPRAVAVDDAARSAPRCR